MKKYQHSIIAIIGLVCIVVGGVFLITKNRADEVYNYYPDSEQAVNSTDQATTSSSANQPQGEGLPVRIEIDDVNINVPVAKGFYNTQNQKWTLSKDNAHYAMMTAKPNTVSGNTFIYGHNRSNVFSRLLRVKPGSIAFVTTDNHKRYVYKMTRTFTTNPTDSGFLNYNGAPTLTLQTCSGANFQNRSLYVFELVGVTNA